MNLRRVRAVARKEFLHVIRDPRSLGMGIAIPMLMLLLFGYALTLDVDNVPFVVWDQNPSPATRDLVSHFDGSPYLTFAGSVANERDIERAIETRRALIAIVIPYDFSRNLSRGKGSDVQLIADGTDSNTATLAIGYAEAIAAKYSEAIVVRNLSARLPGVDLRPRIWFNEDMESRNYIIPSLIAIIMMVIAALLTSLTVAREWETGTMEQLISTPVRVPELLIGKLIPYFAIGMLDVVIAVIFGEFLFHVPLRGSVPLLFAMSAVFLVGGLTLGMLIGIATRSQLLASQLAMVTSFLPAFLLSGGMYSIDNMPKPIQMLTYVIPARYFVTLLKGIYLKGVGLSVLGLEAALLAAWSAIVLVLAHAMFRKKLE
jgi:ABC-type multidrug transport system, permease component